MIGLVESAKNKNSKPALNKSVVQLALERLELDPNFKGRRDLIRIDAFDGKLVLQGNLPSYYLKQMLQTSLSAIDGVETIDNQVDVTWPS